MVTREECHARQVTQHEKSRVMSLLREERMTLRWTYVSSTGCGNGANHLRRFVASLSATYAS
jgi:hypothetical protein